MPSYSNSNGRAFPAGLENASDDAKRSYFEAVAIEHPKLMTAIARAERFLNTGLDKSLIFLTGPSGVGKTVAARFLVGKTNKLFYDSNANDFQRVPAVLIEAWGSERGAFDWVDFYVEILHALQIPLVDKILPTVDRQVLQGTLNTLQVEFTGQISLRTLRNRMRLAFAQRKPKLVAIDEASNILATDSKDIKKPANTLKSIVNTSGTRLLLTGAYDLYALSVLTGQLTRRGAVVHFEAYSLKEIEQFLEALVSLQAHLPLLEAVDLTAHAHELFIKSLGCIGNLKAILYGALDLSLRAQTDITLEMLRESYFFPEQLAKLKEELLDGHRLVVGQEFFQEVRNPPRPSNVANQSNRKQRRPGERNPARDPTGSGRAE
jgi:hypothetical protein